MYNGKRLTERKGGARNIFERGHFGTLVLYLNK
jgi:hypothetical protein